jgi:tRNA A58 N-methylase Trm61
MITSQGVQDDHNPSEDMASRDTSGWSATSYRNVASYVYSSEATASVLQLLDARPGEKILDFGCGSGEVTAEIARLVGPQGMVVGVDTSESMVSRATAFADATRKLTIIPDHESSRDNRVAEDSLHQVRHTVAATPQGALTRLHWELRQNLQQCSSALVFSGSP